MEISKEIIEAQKLTDDQVTAINAFGKTHTDGLVAETKKEYDGKANTDAEAILGGAADKIAEITGLKRESGQKIGDYIGKSWDFYSTAEKTANDKLKLEYETKIADFKGDESTKNELDKTKVLLDDLMKKTADYDTLKETADSQHGVRRLLSGRASLPGQGSALSI